MIRLTECPRDAMQGIQQMIPTSDKVRYLNQVLKVGFDVLDFGSFVSPKTIPQMKDTAEVLQQLEPSTSTQLLAIIANERGAQDASQYERIDILGFPFSVSEEFQQRNTRSSRLESIDRIKKMADLASQYNKTLLIYLSMGFGNPYGEEWSPEIVHSWADKLYQIGIRDFALSDTIGTSNPQLIHQLFPVLTKDFPDAHWGMHLHTTPDTWEEKVTAAYEAGCRRFDGAIKGYGGCPMAKDELTGNMPTEKMIELLSTKESLHIKQDQLGIAMQMAQSIFP